MYHIYNTNREGENMKKEILCAIISAVFLSGVSNVDAKIGDLVRGGRSATKTELAKYPNMKETMEAIEENFDFLKKTLQQTANKNFLTVCSEGARVADKISKNFSASSITKTLNEFKTAFGAQGVPVGMQAINSPKTKATVASLVVLAQLVLNQVGTASGEVENAIRSFCQFIIQQFLPVVKDVIQTLNNSR